MPHSPPHSSVHLQSAHTYLTNDTMSFKSNSYTPLFTFKRRHRRRRVPNSHKPSPNRRLSSINRQFLTPWRNFIIQVVSEDLDAAADWLSAFNNFFLTIFIPYIFLPSFIVTFAAPAAFTVYKFTKGLINGIKVLQSFLHDISHTPFFNTAASSILWSAARVLSTPLTLFTTIFWATQQTKAKTAIPALTLLLLAVVSPHMGANAASVYSYPIPDNMAPAPISTDTPMASRAGMMAARLLR